MRTLNVILIFLLSSVCGFCQEPQKAHDFEGISTWINSEPLEMKNLQGKVILLDFWSYSCINCIRTLPHLSSWHQAYKDKGFVVVGVHTPEFAFEHNVDNVKKAVKRLGIHYPVAMDNEYETWRAYNNKYWPTSYLIDKEGFIRLVHIGEGKYLEMENAIRGLLEMPPLQADTIENKRSLTTPEIYLGSRRAANYSYEIQLKSNSVHTYDYKEPLSEDKVGLKGSWQVAPESVTAVGSDCKIELRFTASKVHIVLSGSSDQPVVIQLDGKALEKQYYTTDMNSKGEIYLDSARKYDLCDLHANGQTHFMTIHVPKGVSAYSFTFGSEP